MARVDEVRDRLERADQAHLLRFYEELSEPQRAQLLDDIDSIDLERVPDWVDRFVKTKPEFDLPRDIDPPLWYPRDPGDKRRPYDAEAYWRRGEELIGAGQVAAFCVAGGQGTRLGWDGPKGAFPATPVTRKPLFQVFSEFIRSAARRYQVTIPFYVMTSPLNHDDTIRFFERHEFFGLDSESVMFFSQGVMPSFDRETGRILLADKHRVAVNPDGHGGSLKALWERGALADMRQRGIRHISYIQVDNPLVRVLDPLFIGLHATAPDSSAEMSSKMVWKAGPTEKVGNFCRVRGRTTVIEYSDLPDELAQRRDANGDLVFCAGSIAIHLLGVDFVERLNTGAEGFALPFHRADKKVAHIDLESGERIEPEEPNAVKLETFVFDALPLCEHSLILESSREEEFAPIKNASGVDSAESSRELQCERAARWLEAAGTEVPRRDDGTLDACIEISADTALYPDDVRAGGSPNAIKRGAELVL
ncbi:MAG: UTP--glucose-1-phosphate uridylyltransferase [Phycisphaerales bacterium]